MSDNVEVWETPDGTWTVRVRGQDDLGRRVTKFLGEWKTAEEAQAALDDYRLGPRRFKKWAERHFDLEFGSWVLKAAIVGAAFAAGYQVGMHQARASARPFPTALYCLGQCGDYIIGNEKGMREAGLDSDVILEIFNDCSEHCEMDGKAK